MVLNHKLHAMQSQDYQARLRAHRRYHAIEQLPARPKVCREQAEKLLVDGDYRTEFF